MISGDFFSEDFQEKYKECFDIVVSRGFIEHFTDPKNVVEKHINILKRGGMLSVLIPNYKCAGSFFVKLLSPEIYKMHNFNIMDKIKFRNIFENMGLKQLYCGYLGTYSLYAPDVARCNLLIRVLKCWGCRVDALVNSILYLFLRGKAIETRWFSPHLRYIGIKE